MDFFSYGFLQSSYHFRGSGEEGGCLFLAPSIPFLLEQESKVLGKIRKKGGPSKVAPLSLLKGLDGVGRCTCVPAWR